MLDKINVSLISVVKNTKSVKCVYRICLNTFTIFYIDILANTVPILNLHSTMLSDSADFP